MTTHLFRHQQWFQPHGESWDCNFLYIAVTSSGEVLEYSGICPADKTVVEELYENRCWHDVELSLHRGKIEWKRDFEVLRERLPHVWKALTSKFEFAEPL